MKPRDSLLLGSAVLAAMLSPAATAGARAGDHGRGCAILSPLESLDAPGHSAANPDAAGCKCTFYPYYSPIIPISCRWRYHPLVPYYCGYCKRAPGCGGAALVFGTGCPDVGLGTYGVYSGAPHDEATLLRLGGGGPLPPHATPDIIDLIQGRGGVDGACVPVPGDPH
jgi:hypothetical protein